MSIRLILGMSVLAAGCASQPESLPVAPVAAQTAPPATTTTAGTTVQEARMAGYKLVNQNGKTVYCRDQLKTGSHMRKDTICLTAEELEAARSASRRNLEQMQRKVPPPQGT